MPKYKITYGMCDGVGPFVYSVDATDMEHAIRAISNSFNRNNMNKCELVRAGRCPKVRGDITQTACMWPAGHAGPCEFR